MNNSIKFSKSRGEPDHSTGQHSYKSLLQLAEQGTYQVPAFQRKWKWSKNQVIALYETLRRGYPIGSFLTLADSDFDVFNPRPFHGIENVGAPSALVLDGQQRLTAGLAITRWGDSLESANHYFIDSRKIIELAKDGAVNLYVDQEAADFSNNTLDADSGYLVSRKTKKTPLQIFQTDGLLWTGAFSDEDTWDAIIDDPGTADDEKLLLKKFIKKYLRPQLEKAVPVIKLENYELSHVAKVFSSMNSSGKSLTPFELVVAALFPSGISIEDDIEEAIQKNSHYGSVDRTGEILLQTVALLSDKSPKKSELPRNITATQYRQHFNVAVSYLDEVGRIFTSDFGVGLDKGLLLAPYDAIYSPAAYALSIVDASYSNKDHRPVTLNKLWLWFCGAALSQRYQEGVHNKQITDAREFAEWAANDQRPSWLDGAEVSMKLKSATPPGALGKLIATLCFRMMSDNAFHQNFHNVKAPKHKMDLTDLSRISIYGKSMKRTLALNQELVLNSVFVPRELGKHLSGVEGFKLFERLQELLKPEEYQWLMRCNFLQALEDVEGAIDTDAMALVEHRYLKFAEYFRSEGFAVSTGSEDDNDDTSEPTD